jgi:deoxyhypusine synthase
MNGINLRISGKTTPNPLLAKEGAIKFNSKGKFMGSKNIRSFVKQHFRHFNAATLADAAEAYRKHIDEGGYMLVSVAGALSTAEIGLSLAEMIRQGKVHAISCTGANLEEDIFNLVAHDHYLRIPNYRDLTPAEEQALLDRHLNRVTDTCIPEEAAIRCIEEIILDEWKKVDKDKKRYFPHEFIYKLIREEKLNSYYQINAKESWVIAASEKNLPLFVPGWEDSTLGNIFASHCLRGNIKDVNCIRNGIEYMMHLTDWYKEVSSKHNMGLFQIGGGIAGDFAICVVPLLRQDLGVKQTKLWNYFCQISDSTTSYGSYSGAIPNEKITWEKLGINSSKFIIESDATIVAPLLFNYVLDE